MLTYGSLFTGIGGFDLGFDRAGMRCVWQVEIDDYATKVLEKHWPNVPRWRDVRTFPQPGFERPDVICGGFPCQDISYAGRGAGLDGERSGLFFEAVRVVRELQPRIVVLENVAGLLTRGLDRVLGTLVEIGFDAEWHCIPAAAVGAPHIRDRVFILAYAEHERIPKRRGTEMPCSANNIGGVSSNGSPSLRVKENPVDANADGTGLEKWQGQDTRGTGPICRAQPGRSEWWDVEPDVGRVANGVPSRVDRLRCLGNAVVPQVAEWIGRRIVAADDAR